MKSKFIVTVVSSDKPGVVESIANCVKNCEGNWLESRLAQMAGKFAGVISVSIPTAEADNLKLQLENLKAEKNIHAFLDNASELESSHYEGLEVGFSVSGPDRVGIVQELSKAISDRNINLQTLSSEISSMPYSGEPLFSASGKLTVPTNVGLNELNDSLNQIADSLGVDFSLHTEEESNL